jgi:hypothetical protein
MNLPVPPPPVVKTKWSLYKRWQIFAPTGLILTGMGLCLFGTANHLMHSGEPFFRWFIAGTISLVTFNSGLALFGEAVRCRTLYDLRKNLRKKKRRTKSRSIPGKQGPRPESPASGK